MGHMDEKILDFINEAEKAMDIKNICEEPVKIGNRYYEFEEQGFFEDKLKIYIPKDFQDMPEEFKNLKYPSIHRPKIIKTDETGSVNITLNPVNSFLNEESVEKLTQLMKGIIRKTNPANVFYTEGIEKVEDKNIGYFEFKSSAIDNFMYNLMFIFEFREKTVIGTFSCLYKECKEWREYAFQMIKTIRVIKEEE